MIVMPPPVVAVNPTLLNVSPAPANVGDALEQLIVDVPALNVRFVASIVIEEVPDKVMVDEPKLTVHADTLAFRIILPEVILKLPVLKVP